MRAFTLIEILVVVAIFSVLTTLALFMSMETFRGTLYRSEESVVVSLLEKARSRALANVDQTSWGVCYIAPDYVIFRGSSCTAGISTNELIPASDTNPATFSGPIIFSALSGDSGGGTVTLSENGRTNTITINHEGAILW